MRIVNEPLSDPRRSDSGDYYAGFRKQARRVLTEAAAERRALRKQVNSLWGPALRRLEANLHLAHHLGREFNELEREAKHFGAVRHALFVLHANACLVGSEVIVLLRTGHANGAQARWRSLHEIAVFSEFIRQEGDDVAKRYLDHNIVKAWEDANAWQDHAEPEERISDEDMRQLNADVQALKQQYGEPYVGIYGWASEALRKRNPGAKSTRVAFDQLEKAVDFVPLMKGQYRQASHSVHPTSKGAHFNLSNPPLRRYLPSAPSPYGLFEPGWNTCRSLYLATATLLSIDLDEHRKAALQTFTRLTGTGLHLFAKCQMSLDQALQSDSKAPG